VTPTLAQQDRNLYFQQPDGSIEVIVPGGPGYVIAPFPALSYLQPVIWSAR
jgi:hypothetical protein